MITTSEARLNLSKAAKKLAKVLDASGDLDGVEVDSLWGIMDALKDALMLIRNREDRILNYEREANEFAERAAKMRQSNDNQ